MFFRMCRICLEKGGGHYCQCKGTCALVHAECLERWIKVSNRTSCEICEAEYKYRKTFSPRFYIEIFDFQLSKHMDTTAVCCAIGFALFLINFILSIILNSFFVNIIASNIFSLLVVSFSINLTNPLNLYIYFSIMTCMSNVLVLNKVAFDVGTHTFFAQCILCVTLIFTWFCKIVWRSSWVLTL